MKDYGKTFLDTIRATSKKQQKVLSDLAIKEQEHNRLMRIEAAKKAIPYIIESIKLVAAKGEEYYNYYYSSNSVEVDYIIGVLKEEYQIPWIANNGNSLYIYWGDYIYCEKTVKSKFFRLFYNILSWINN